MTEVFAFLRENAEWVFGSGGAAALLLGLVKLLKRPGAPAAETAKAPPAGDVIGGDKTVVTSTGFGALEVGLALAVIVAAMGAVFWTIGPSRSIAADDCSAAVQGDGNQVTVTGGASCG